MTQHNPPMDPNSSEATGPQLKKARAQGDAYGQAVKYMVEEVAHDGGIKQAGEYTVGYAIEEAEGLYHFKDGQLTWQNPEGENVHVEIAVQDTADGRFVPAVTVTASLVTPTGQELGPYEHELVWHPMLYHYARNWVVPEDGGMHPAGAHRPAHLYAPRRDQRPALRAACRRGVHRREDPAGQRARHPTPTVNG
ncbi:hypothetical protein [Marisediminicola antarctica]|uniref:hypothetical protein n=1 Tax=Marisediminicola antarctica TaxID=674079 RepID=UPI00137B28A6|nr:hypothetical protein [Marisediminicola antarctica]